VTIPNLLNASIGKSDVDVRPLLYENVVLTGGNTLLTGFADRLYAELHQSAPGFKIKVHAAGASSDRKFGPWIGGSVLSSLDTFAPLWLTKQQYEEHGPSVEGLIF
jgi:actin-related protein